MGLAKNSPALTRRSFIAGAVAASGAGLARGRQRDYGQGASPVRYPEPDVVVLDRRFGKYKLGNAAIERLHTGMRWAEGPAWSNVGRYLVWSDVAEDTKYRWLADDGRVSVFQTPSNHSNGNTFDFQGRLISCEHATHSVVRREHNGDLTVLAAEWQGKPLNAPNDVVAHPDGSVWFTDPGYGSLYEGGAKVRSVKESIYRIDPGAGKMNVVTDAVFKPNGLCFSPDYKRLYVAETGSSHYPEAPRSIMSFEVDGGGLRGGKEFASMKMTVNGKEVAGVADGIRADVDGNIWAGCGWAGPGYDGVHVFAPDGERIGQILLPEICSNLCFGGPARNRLFMTASRSLYSLYVETQGAHIA